MIILHQAGVKLHQAGIMTPDQIARSKTFQYYSVYPSLIRRMAEKQLGQSGVFHATLSRPALFKIRARHVMTPNTEKVFNNASIGIANGHFKNDFCDSNETCQDIVVTHDDAFYLKGILQVTKSIKQTTKH